MYKIIIADDETAVIDSLTHIIHQQLKESCVIESAGTGRQVIELAESFRPDIIFLDIHLTGINGIEAMREIRRENASILFIVVSAQMKFEYAKAAIGIGVLEYLNKPVDKEAIRTTLNRAIKQVDEARKQRSSALADKEKLEIVTPVIERGFLYAMLYRNGKEEMDSFRTFLGIHEETGYVMSLQLDEMHGQEADEETEKAGDVIQREYSGIRDVIKSYFRCSVGAVMDNMIPIFVPTTAEDEEYQLRIRVIETARKMIRDLAQTVGVRFRLGIGSIHDFYSLAESYNEAMRSLASNSTDLVVHANDLPISGNYDSDYPVDIENLLFQNVGAGNRNQAVYYAKIFFDWMLAQYSQNVMDVKLKTLEIVFHAERIGYENGSMLHRFTMRSEYLETVMGMFTYEQLYEWFEAKISEVCRNILTKKEQSTVDLVKKAKLYIERNYAKDLMLDEVSRQLQISPYYFSKLFKKRTGNNFIEYVTNVRMEKAKELLRNSDKSMKEICIEVGYSDANYFSRTFKKNVGVSPTEYKEEGIALYCASDE